MKLEFLKLNAEKGETIDVSIGNYESFIDWHSIENEIKEKILLFARKHNEIGVITLNGQRLKNSCSKGMARQEVLFNATKGYDYHVKINNTGKGALTKYWCSENVKYKNGSVFLF